MKLVNIKFREAVREPGIGGSPTAFYSADRGFDITVEQGFVYLRKGGATRLVPMSNVVDAEPAEETAPVAKKK